MADRDQEMMDYIDEHIMGERTSDAAEDSAGAAWAAYERGEYEVPDWYRKEHRARNGSKSTIVEYIQNKPSLNWDTFLRSMGILFLALIVIIILIVIFT